MVKRGTPNSVMSEHLFFWWNFIFLRRPVQPASAFRPARWPWGKVFLQPHLWKHVASCCTSGAGRFQEIGGPMKSLGKARMVGWSSFSLFDGGTVDFFRLGLNSLRLRVYFVYHGSLGLFFVALFWFMHEQWELLVGWRVVCLSQSECGCSNKHGGSCLG